MTPDWADIETSIYLRLSLWYYSTWLGTFFVLIKKIHRSNKAVTVWKQYCNRVSTIISMQCLFKKFLAQDSEIGNLTEALCKHFSFYRLSKRNRHVNATNFDNDIKIWLTTTCWWACGGNNPHMSSNTVYSDVFTSSLAVIHKWRVLLTDITTLIVIVYVWFLKESQHRKNIPSQETSYSWLTNLTTCLHL